MKIYRKKDKLIVELNYYQHKNNPYDANEEKEWTNNLIGVIAGDEQGVCQLNDLSYKDAQQVGNWLVMTDLSNDVFRKLCNKLDIACYEYPVCNYCEKVIWGTFTYGDKGTMCFECEAKHEK